MQPGANNSTATVPSGRPAIKLRDEHFVRVTNFLGITKDAQRAEFCGVAPNTLYRARAGADLTQVFIANTLAALGPHRELLANHRLAADFDALFELVGVER